MGRDFSQPLKVSTTYLDTSIEATFPSVLDEKMQKGIARLHNNKIQYSRGGKAKINAFDQRCQFFDRYCIGILGIDPPEGVTDEEFKTGFAKFVPSPAKEDLVSQIENASSIDEEDEGN